MNDMTPEKVHFIKLDGEQGEKWDDGAREAMSLARQSIAMRLMEFISQVLDDLPEREKIACPTCDGTGRCPQCGGRGCVTCEDDGQCSCCGGRGIIPIL
jgi:hypothetical protein